MKGVVFTEFLKMVENASGYDIVDRIIEQSNLSTGGAYTAVGTYDFQEFLQLVIQLGRETNTEVSHLVRNFGEHLFGRFSVEYPQFFENDKSAFAFLQKVEEYIHVEVRKLYPDAELPRFEFTTHGANKMELTYRSSRPFADLAEGLIIGCVKHFGERIGVERENLDGKRGTAARFLLTCEQGATQCTT